MYHNLVQDNEATWFWRTIKPLLKYIILVDFGRTTTVNEMRLCLQRNTARRFTMRPFLTCTLKDMHVLGQYACTLMNTFSRGSGNRSIVQYLVEVDADSKAS